MPACSPRPAAGWPRRHGPGNLRVLFPREVPHSSASKPGLCRPWGGCAPIEHGGDAYRVGTGSGAAWSAISPRRSAERTATPHGVRYSAALRAGGDAARRGVHCRGVNPGIPSLSRLVPPGVTTSGDDRGVGGALSLKGVDDLGTRRRRPPPGAGGRRPDLCASVTHVTLTGPLARNAYAVDLRARPRAMTKPTGTAGRQAFVLLEAQACGRAIALSQAGMPGDDRQEPRCSPAARRMPWVAPHRRRPWRGRSADQRGGVPRVGERSRAVGVTGLSLRCRAASDE